MLLQEQNMTLMVKERKNCHSVLVTLISSTSSQRKTASHRGWLLGRADGLNEGVVPANYVKVRDLCSLWYSNLRRAIARVRQTKTPASVNIPPPTPLLFLFF